VKQPQFKSKPRKKTLMEMAMVKITKRKLNKTAVDSMKIPPIKKSPAINSTQGREMANKLIKNEGTIL